MIFTHKSFSLESGLKQVRLVSITGFCLCLIGFIMIAFTSYPIFQDFENRWHSDRLQSTIDQTEDIVKIRKIAKYACHKVDVTSNAMKGMNQSVLLFLLLGMSSYLVILIVLFKTRKKQNSCG